MSKKDALSFIANVRLKYPDARHHCWAYVAGSPLTITLGMSDDGEPQGTAGKPMLNVLQHKKIGDIVVVVSRYFGGIKLGAGGLVRAYASSVQHVIDQLPLRQFIPTQTVRVMFPYSFESDARYAVEKYHATMVEVNYGEQVLMCFDIDSYLVEEMKVHLSNKSKGTIVIL